MLRLKQILSIILIITIVVTTMPSKVFAADISNVTVSAQETKPVTNPVTNPSGKRVPKIIGEVAGKRSAYIKQFMLDDNSYEADVYREPVNYFDNGSWKEVDNTLSDAKDTSVVSEDSSIASSNTTNIVKNKANDYEVSFAKNANVNKLVNLQKDNYELSWNVENAQNIQHTILTGNEDTIHNSIVNGVTDIINSGKEFAGFTAAEKQNAKDTLISNEIQKSADKASSELTYNGILPNVDLKYKVNSRTLKEDIILNKYTKNFIITFGINTKGLSARLENNNTISFYDEKNPSNVIFSTAIPVMYDQNGVSSNDINVKLDDTGNGYQLVLTPSDSWLSDSTRSYPVVIDPVVNAVSASATIKDTYVSSLYPTTLYYNSMKLGVGQRTTSDYNISFIRFDLPTLSPSSMVTNATLTLNSTSLVNGGAQVNVHKISNSWDSTTLNWNNKPSYDNTIVDYQTVNTAGKEYDFDITSIAKDWYTTGYNNGLVLDTKSGSTGYASFDSSDNGAGSSGKPEVSIFYVDYSGLEGYWTYHSQDVLRAGTAYINDYNGNLVFVHDDLGMSGNRMPLTVSHVFNSNDRQTDIGFGVGWRLNLSQRLIKGQSGDPFSYYYLDEDGTKHYFKSNPDGTYSDESGLNLTLTVNTDGTYTVKDTKDNILKFTSSGYLSSITDSNANSITLSYSGTTLTSATDGAGRKTTFDYTNGKLSGITDPSGRKTSYAYTGTELTKITYPDTKASTYAYDSNSNLTSATNYDGYKITYSYSSGDIKRVSKATETGTNGEAGNGLNIAYGYNTTSFTDQKGRKDIYQFNDSGNTVSIKDSDNNAQYYEYGSDSNVNKLTSQSDLQKTTINYIKNHNVESASSFSLANNGGTGTGSYSTESSYQGNQSLKITKTDNLNSEFYYQKYKMDLGKSYTFSAYVRTQDISASNGKGAYISAWYTDNSGVIKTSRSKYLSGDNEWTRLETTVTLPSDLTDNTVTVRLGIQSETGTAYFDCLQLEDGSLSNRYNLVENGDFRGGSLSFWNTTGTDTNDSLTTNTNYPAVIDASSYKINGNSLTDKNIYQIVNVSGKAGDVFVASAWAKAASVPLNDGTRKFALKLEFVNTDSTTTDFEIPFNQDSSDWQYVSGKAIAAKEYNSIKIFGEYSHNENTAYFDGFRLYKEEFGESYQYDAKGNITSTTDIADQNNSFDYNGTNDLVKATDPKGSSFQYEYNNGVTGSTKHNLTKATSSENVVYSFSYDQYGNALTSKITGADIFTESDASYTADGNYTSTITDAKGNTVNYNYNATKGTLDSVTDANGNTTNYAYDTMDNLTSVSENTDGQTVTDSYAYENDNLKTITHNGFDYNFSYDGFGNNTNVSVGNQNLITNTYEDITHNLKQSAYGNGQTISYGYDSLDRLNSKTLSTGNAFGYQYDSEGNLAYLNDPVNNVAYRYLYDLSGKLMKVTDTLGNITKFSFDRNNNLNRLIQNINGSSYNTKYLYDKDNRPLSVLYNADQNNIYNKLDKNLIAYYSFDNNDVTDESGNGNDGTLKNGATFTDGKFGRALKLDGVDDWAELTDFDVPETFTVSMWVNPYSAKDGQAFLGKHTADGGNIFLMGYWSGTSQIRIRSDVNTQADKTTGYQHLVAVVTKISDTQSEVKYYRNNVLLWDNTINDAMGNTSGRGWTLGQEWDGNTLSDFFNGEIDEVAFYNKALSSDEVNELFNASNGLSSVNYQYDEIGRLASQSTSTGSYTFNTAYTYEQGVLKKDKNDPTSINATTTKVSSINNDGNTLSYTYDRNGNIKTITGDKAHGNTQTSYQYNALNELTKDETKVNDGLLAYYSFDASDARDDSGNGNDGTLNGSPSFVPGKSGNAVELDGTDDYVELKDFDVPDAFSISMWVDPYTTADDQCFLGKNTSDGGNILLAGFWSGSNHVSIRGDAYNGGTQTTGYQHWVIDVSKVNSSTTHVKFYKDGRLISEDDLNATLDNIKGKPWTIGQEWDGGSTSSFLKGAVDEVAFYDHELTADEINQLYTGGVTVNKGNSTAYTYDAGGNITSKTIAAYDPATGETTSDTINYGYGDSNWKDKLTSYDGKTITYDAIGNLLTYDGYTYSWQNGRGLAGISGNGLTTGYKYNNDGIRTQKTVNGITTTYYLNGDQVSYEESYNVSDPGTKFNKIYYTYGGDGQLVSMNLDGVEYYYIRNAQGDIIGLFDKDGVQVAAYTYDSWGKLISIKDQNGNDITNNQSSAGYINPYRYRGYRYDNETGLYYVGNRYYNPEWGRFINPDDTSVLTATPTELTDKNLYAYCDNNPIMRADDDGHFWHIVIGAAIGAFVGLAGQVVSDAVQSALSGKVCISNWQTYVGAAVGGAAGGAVFAATGNVGLANATTGAVTTGVGLSLEKITGKSNKSWAEIGANTVADGAVSFGLGKLPGVKGITKGRNSYSAVYKSGLTKMRNGVVKRMSAKVIRKGVVSSFVGGLSLDGYYGAKQYGYDRVKYAFGR